MNTDKLIKDLNGLGVIPSKLHYNLSYEELFEYETSPELKDYAKVFVTKSGAVAVDTGIFTGRSPKDKYVVYDDTTKDTVWWKNEMNKNSDNKPMSTEVWTDLKQLVTEYLNGKELFVMDAFVGASEKNRLPIRVITDIAWAAHFVKNMFIVPTEKELENFSPKFIMLHAPRVTNKKWQEHKLNSDVFVTFNYTENMALVGGTWYGGEIKKGFFSVMNYFLPLKNIASMHCSANMGKSGDTAIFFGLSGTGKTTLSADPERFLIGDDEHGWDDDGVFNFEGGCYAKCINLDPKKEPQIYNAIRRNTILENVVYDPETGEIDYSDASKTENTRASYPLSHIPNAVIPSVGPHPQNIIFLTADAFGVLPPVAVLSPDEAMYYFISGYTAKLAGTERGIIEPVPTFSAAFGAAFLTLPPIVYARLLAEKMQKHNAHAYLVNTGWIGGPYGVGKRIDIDVSRKIIHAILDGSILKTQYQTMPFFNLKLPKHLEGINDEILNPRNTWEDKSAYDNQAQKLAQSFIDNFQRFAADSETSRLVNFGPKL